MPVPNYRLLPNCSHFTESTTLCGVLRAGLRNRFWKFADHCLHFLCSNFIVSTTLSVELREGCGNILYQFLIIAFSSPVNILLSLQLCVWCAAKDLEIDYVSS